MGEEGRRRGTVGGRKKRNRWMDWYESWEFRDFISIFLIFLFI